MLISHHFYAKNSIQLTITLIQQTYDKTKALLILHLCQSLPMKSSNHNPLFLLDDNFIMRLSNSIFFPIQTQFSDQKIFAKRHTLFRRGLKPCKDQTIGLGETVNPHQVHDTYASMKKKLEDFILKQKSKISLHINSEQYKLSNSKSKFIFRKKSNNPQNRTASSTIFFPSEEIRLSFNENLKRAKIKYKKELINRTYQSQFHPNQQTELNQSHKNATNQSKKQKQNGFNNKTLPIKPNEEENLSKSEMNQKIFKTHHQRKRQIKSTMDGNIQVNSHSLDLKSRQQVFICSNFKSDELQDLEKKKHELIKINHQLKIRNAIKFKIRHHLTEEKGNDIGPWSKTRAVEEQQNQIGKNNLQQ